MINNQKVPGEWKIQLTMPRNFIYSKNSDETRIMHTKSDNIEIVIGNKTDEIIQKLFESFLQKHQEGLKEKIKGSEFVFDSFDRLYYKFHTISLNRGRSYKDTRKWLKNKKTTINPKNNDEKCFEYAVTVALDNEQIKSHPEKTSNIKPFIEQYDWK